MALAPGGPNQTGQQPAVAVDAPPLAGLAATSLGAVLSDAALWLTEGLEDRWTEVGRLLGQAARAGADVAGGEPDLGWLLEPFFAAAGSAAATKEQLQGLLLALGQGEEGLTRAACEWLHETFDEDSPPALLASGAGETLADAWRWLWSWILQLLGLLNDGLLELLEGLTDLTRLLERLQGLPDAVLGAPQLEAAHDSAARLRQVLRGGLLRWLRDQAQASGRSMVATAHDALALSNPLMTWAGRASDAVVGLLGDVGEATAGLTRQRLDALQAGLDALTALERQLWGIVFRGQAGEPPCVVVARADGVFDDALPSFDAGFLVDWATLPFQPSFLTLEGRLQRLQVPHPTSAARVDWEEPPPPGTPGAIVDLPLPFTPLAWDASVAIAHLPEFYVIDMRYHMPYGALGLYRIADFDGDGRVGENDVQRVRDALGKKGSRFDLDGDGVVTAKDVALAEEQQDLYVAQVMYRRVRTAPVGFWSSLSPLDWVFATVTSLDLESVPGKVERRGLLALVDGYQGVPVPDPAGGSPLAYPLRYHLEQRVFVDHFPAFDLLKKIDGAPDLGVFGLGPPVPGTRTDVIVRGGWDGCRDWQFHGEVDAFNPLLRTWILRASYYVRGLVVGAGVAQYSEVGLGAGGKGDLRLQAVYETEAPLIDVLKQWHDRFGALLDDPPTLPVELPVPWQMIVDTLEYTELPRLSRSLVQIAGPFLDLLFDWTDPDHHLRAVLGHLRQTVLNRWEPAPTWAQVRRDVRAWAGVSATERDAVLAAVTAVQLELDAGDHDAVFVAERVWKSVRAALRALPSRESPRAPLTRRPGGIGASGGREDSRREAAERERTGGTPAEAATRSRAEELAEELFVRGRARFAASLDDLVRPHALTTDDARRDPPGRCAIPLCGELEVLDPYLIAIPFEVADAARVKASAAKATGEKKKEEKKPPAEGKAEEADGTTAEDVVEVGQAIVDDPTLDEATRVRGNPFYKPIYHAALELGPDALLYAAPRRSLELLIDPVPGGWRAVVEGRRVLREVTTGDVWLWVRLQDWRHGWLCVDAALWEKLTSPASIALGWAGGAAKQAAPLLIDPRVLGQLERLRGALGDLLPRPITHLEPSPRDTVDESAWAWRCREALARLSVSEADLARRAPAQGVPQGASSGRGAAGGPVGPAQHFERAKDRAVQLLHEACAQELKIRVFGYEHAQAMGEDGDADRQDEDRELGKVFTTLSHAKREALWSAGTAWIKCFHYVPVAGGELVERFLDAILGRGEELTLEQRARRAWDALLDVLSKCAETTPMEVLLAAQRAAPALKEVIATCLDVADKLLAAKAMVQKLGKEQVASEGKQRVFERHGGGKVPGLGSLGPDPAAPEWRNLGAMLARLAIDDPEEPGRPAAAPHGNPAHDWGITFAYDVTIDDLGVQEPEVGAPDAKEVVVYVAEPAVIGAAVDPPGGAPPDDGLLTLKVTKWGYYLHTPDGPELILDDTTDRARYPEGLRAEDVAWRFSRDRGATWEPLAARGATVEVDLIGEEIAGDFEGQLWFEPYLGEPLARVFGDEEADPLDAGPPPPPTAEEDPLDAGPPPPPEGPPPPPTAEEDPLDAGPPPPPQPEAPAFRSPALVIYRCLAPGLNVVLDGTDFPLVDAQVGVDLPLRALLVGADLSPPSSDGPFTWECSTPASAVFVAEDGQETSRLEGAESTVTLRPLHEDGTVEGPPEVTLTCRHELDPTWERTVPVFLYRVELQDGAGAPFPTHLAKGQQVTARVVAKPGFPPALGFCWSHEGVGNDDAPLAQTGEDASLAAPALHLTAQHGAGPGVVRLEYSFLSDGGTRFRAVATPVIVALDLVRPDDKKALRVKWWGFPARGVEAVVTPDVPGTFVWTVNGVEQKRGPERTLWLAEREPVPSDAAPEAIEVACTFEAAAGFTLHASHTFVYQSPLAAAQPDTQDPLTGRYEAGADSLNVNRAGRYIHVWWAPGGFAQHAAALGGGRKVRVLRGDLLEQGTYTFPLVDVESGAPAGELSWPGSDRLWLSVQGGTLTFHRVETRPILSGAILNHFDVEPRALLEAHEHRPLTSDLLTYLRDRLSADALGPLLATFFAPPTSAAGKLFHFSDALGAIDAYVGDVIDDFLVEDRPLARYHARNLLASETWTDGDGPPRSCLGSLLRAMLIKQAVTGSLGAQGEHLAQVLMPLPNDDEDEEQPPTYEYRLDYVGGMFELVSPEIFGVNVHLGVLRVEGPDWSREYAMTYGGVTAAAPTVSVTLDESFGGTIRSRVPWDPEDFEGTVIVAGGEFAPGVGPASAFSVKAEGVLFFGSGAAPPLVLDLSKREGPNFGATANNDLVDLLKDLPAAAKEMKKEWKNQLAPTGRFSVGKVWKKPAMFSEDSPGVVPPPVNAVPLHASERVSISTGATFAVNDPFLSPDARQRLGRFCAEHLAAFAARKARLDIVGYADSSGGASFNDALSRWRAANTDRMFRDILGPDHPQLGAHTGAGALVNERRVDVWLGGTVVTSIETPADEQEAE